MPVSNNTDFKVILPEIPLNSLLPLPLDKKIPLVDFNIQKNLLKAIKKYGKEIKTIDNENLFVKTRYSYSGIQISVLTKQIVANNAFKRQHTEYLKKLEKYQEDTKTYKDKIKQFNINMQVWAAWKIKEQQEKLENEISGLQDKIKKIEERKKEMLTEDCQQGIKKEAK